MRKIAGVACLLVFISSFILIFIYKEKIENMKSKDFIALILAILLFAGFELIWPSKKKTKS